MTENVDLASTTTKELDEINTKALADSLALALSEQVGGEFKVSLTKLERTNLELVLQFHVKDKNSLERGEWAGQASPRQRGRPTRHHATS